MKRTIAYLPIVVAALLLVFGPIPAYSAAKVDKIGITYVKLPLNVPAILVKRLGLLEKEFGPDGIVIQRPEFIAGPQQTQAMAAGSVQLTSVLGSDSAILGKANGIDLKVVAAFSRAPKAFSVMTKNPAIKTVADLKGRTVAGPKGTLLHHLLFAVLKQSGLKPADVKFVNMGIPQAQAALISGSIDAALIAGPSLVPAEAAGARVLANGEGIVGGLTVIAVSGAFLRDHPDLVKRYLKVHDQALRYLKNNPAESIRIVAEETQISEADVKRMLPWYDFGPTLTDDDLADLAVTQAFLKANDMLTNTIDMKDLIAQPGRW
jgi:sulfonate transport system substrate-binding protein